MELSIWLVVQEVEVVPQEQLVLDFASGTGGNTKESGKLPVAFASTTLGNVGGNGGGGSAYLGSEPETLLCGEVPNGNEPSEEGA